MWPGYLVTGAGAMKSVPAGKFNPSGKSGGCTDCYGYYSKQELVCSVGPVESRLQQGGVTCEKCPKGKFQPQEVVGLHRLAQRLCTV